MLRCCLWPGSLQENGFVQSILRQVQGGRVVGREITDQFDCGVNAQKISKLCPILSAFLSMQDSKEYTTRHISGHKMFGGWEIYPLGRLWIIAYSKALQSRLYWGILLRPRPWTTQKELPCMFKV